MNFADKKDFATGQKCRLNDKTEGFIGVYGQFVNPKNPYDTGRRGLSALLPFISVKVELIEEGDK